MTTTANQKRFAALSQKTTTFRLRHANLAWLPLCLLAGLISIAFGQDASWDLQNYHLYNGFALFHPHRRDVDIAQVQSFLNPVLDIPLYLLTVAFPYAPRLVAFCMGLPFGLLAFFTFRVARRLFGARPHGAIIAALLGLTGTATVSQIGLSTNEIPVAVLVIAGFDALLIAIAARAATLRPLLLAGLLTGLAAGGKLTAAPYAIGLAAATLTALPPRRLPAALAAIGAAGMLGAAITGGPWMAHLAGTYGNPIFPYDNQIFQSDWAGPWGYNDTRFFPATTQQWLFFPFWWARRNAMVVTEVPFADPRFAVLFLAAPAAGLAALFRRRLAAFIPAPAWRAAIIFWLAAYLGWEKMFSIYRYAVPLEVLGGMLVIGAVNAMLGGWPRAAAAIATILTAAICTATIYPDWGHCPFHGNAVPAVMPSLPARSLIVSTDDSAVAFLALRAPRQTVFVGANGNFLVPDTSLTWRSVTNIIESWKGPIEIIEPALGDAPSRDIIAAAFNLIATDQCRIIRAAWNDDTLRLCTAHFQSGSPSYQPAISFGLTAADASATYLRDGWAPPESFGRWTDATDATIVLPLNPANTRKLRLTVLAFSVPSTPGRHVDVYANNRLVARWVMAGFTALTQQATIPGLGGARQLTLRFHIPDATAPYPHASGRDTRPLGMAVMHVSVQEILTGG